jgi:hypothetical protein
MGQSSGHETEDLFERMDRLERENTQLRDKLRSTKQYLRSANRGAERNAIVSQLLAARNVKLLDELFAFRESKLKIPITNEHPPMNPIRIDLFQHDAGTEADGIGHKLDQLLERTAKIMATQAEEAVQLQAFADRLTALKAAIDALKVAIANSGNTTPAVDTALANVDAALKADEDDAAPSA